jgi:hypothetical protein
MHSRIYESESGSNSNSKTDPTSMPILRDYSKFDVNIESCASEFAFYSATELGYLDQSVLHALLSSSSLRLENENSLLTILIELGDKYFDFWSYLEVPLLSDEWISQFVDHLLFLMLISDIRSKTVIRLKGVSDEELRHHRYCTCTCDSLQQKVIQFESTILSPFPTFLNDIAIKTL